ncbi:protein-methionine-sulfoxide reductase heme-binding subunit MsrQ [Gemmobacter straminiformis]|uniref:Protein-methionine-sulfoxide reductase heme-binding subunit MsrQ n=1 Tax=Paragemmobacter straminiformis TaxID=2045119 RepID=A0A842I8K3_9RHOB|nr:protein-methionine-sulfoxide reductase heme-binding subunit MsrQ [Gemmobacter straminiformis]
MPAKTCPRISEVESLNQLFRRLPTWAVYLAGVLPFLWIVWLAVTGGLGADPVKAIELRLGELGLQFLIGGLVITPLRWFGLNLMKFRRAVGLVAFFYIAMHLSAWVVLDMGLRWSEMANDLVKRWYIIIGMAGFAAMIPLAVTSNNASVKRLGAAAWRRLHKLTYVAVLAGAVHYVVLVKAWPVEPLLYLGAAILLLAARAWKARARFLPVSA